MAGTTAIGLGAIDLGAIDLGAAAFRPALAQSYPSGVIRIVVPYSASTPPDILARIVATALSEAGRKRGHDTSTRDPRAISQSITGMSK